MTFSDYLISLLKTKIHFTTLTLSHDKKFLNFLYILSKFYIATPEFLQITFKVCIKFLPSFGVQGKCISFDEQIDYLATVYGVLVQQLGAEKTVDHLSKSIFAVVIGSNELIKYAKSDPADSTSPEDFVATLVATLQDQLKVCNFKKKDII